MSFEQLVEKSDQIDNLLNKTSLNWNVRKTPLLTEEGIKTPYFGIQRVDTGEVFTTCKAGYTTFQNSQLAELLFEISNRTSFAIERGGSLNEGRKVFLQLHTGDTDINGDKVKKYITGLNSHDGSTSLGFGNSNIVISCQNTFQMAMRQVENKIRHTSGMQDNIDRILRQMDELYNEQETLYANFARMTGVPNSETAFNKVVETVTGIDPSKPVNELEATYGPRKVGKANNLIQSIKGEVQQKGNTLWGLFNGVTHFTTHKAQAPKRDNGQVESKMVGTNQKIDEMVYDLINEMLGVPA